MKCNDFLQSVYDNALEVVSQPMINSQVLGSDGFTISDTSNTRVYQVNYDNTHDFMLKMGTSEIRESKRKYPPSLFEEMRRNYVVVPNTL